MRPGVNLPWYTWVIAIILSLLLWYAIIWSVTHLFIHLTGGDS